MTKNWKEDDAPEEDARQWQGPTTQSKVKVEIIGGCEGGFKKEQSGGGRPAVN